VSNDCILSSILGLDRVRGELCILTSPEILHGVSQEYEK